MRIRIIQWDDRQQEEVHCLCYRTHSDFLRYEYSHDDDHQHWDKTLLCCSQLPPQQALDMHPDLILSPFEMESVHWQILKGMQTPWNAEFLVRMLAELIRNDIPLEVNRILQFTSCPKTKTESRINTLRQQDRKTEIWWFEQNRQPDTHLQYDEDPGVHRFFLRKKSDQDIICTVREKEC